MIGRESVIDLLALQEDKVSGIVRRKLLEIVALCKEFRYLGKRFTFDKNKSLESNVNRLFVELSDLLEQLVEDEVLQSVFNSEEDEDYAPILLSLRSAENLVRLDAHASHLKNLLEAYVAIGFAFAWSGDRVVTEMLTWLDNPYGSPYFRSATKDKEYEAGIITAGGYHYGKGVQQNPVKGITVLVQGLIYTAFVKGVVGVARKNPKLIGFRVRRGSSFDCPYCDEACVPLYAPDEVPIPLHPRCMCYPVPIYSE